MLPDYDEFKRRMDALREEIGVSCARAGRPRDGVRILPVTKNHPPEAAEYVARYGLPAVGENRVQEAVDKRSRSQAAVRWELIGHLQSNKAALAARTFDRVQSVDSEKLLNFLARAADELGKTLPILLQVNSGRDPAKFGADPEEVPRLLEASLGKKSLAVEGLMAIAPLSDDLAVASRAFENLREIRDGLAARFGVPLRELSMGMSADFAEAILHGSTLVRIGTALFGPRK